MSAEQFAAGVSKRQVVVRCRGMRNVSTLVIAALASCTTPTQEPVMTAKAPTPPTTANAVRHGHVLANGVNYYYEIHGRGEPLLLLHGGLGSIEMFEPGLPALAKSREVIAVEYHGHGRTQLGDRKISLIDQGDDMAVILDKLGYAKVDVAGYSLGGGIALRLAVQHPDKVRKLALISTTFSIDGFFPEILPMQAALSGQMAEMMKDTPIYKSYAAIAPDPSEFPKLLDRMGEYMRQRYDWSADVKKLTMPVILIFGDSDMIRLDHAVEFYKLLGGGQRDAGWQREHLSQNRLAILPDVTHYEIGMSPLLPSTILNFLDSKAGAPQPEEVARP
jgi:pimeloyl-ACP methyl ester carboxylesterase